MPKIYSVLQFLKVKTPNTFVLYLCFLNKDMEWSVKELLTENNEQS